VHDDVAALVAAVDAAVGVDDVFEVVAPVVDDGEVASGDGVEEELDVRDAFGGRARDHVAVGADGVPQARHRQQEHATFDEEAASCTGKYVMTLLRMPPTVPMMYKIPAVVRAARW
jgi:hypothetical protein